MPDSPEQEPSLEERLAPHLPKFLAALAATGAGLGAYGYLRRQRLSSDPALAAIQTASKGKYTYLARGSEEGTNPIIRALNKLLMAGGGDVAYAKDLNRRSRLIGQAKVEGALLHDAAASAKGDVDLLGKGTEAFSKLFGHGDKAVEAKIFQKYAPGSVPGTTLMSELDVPFFGNRLKAYEEQLRQKYPGGYILKTTQGAATRGKFPTDAKALAETLAAGGPEADVVKQLLKNPTKVIAQEKVRIKPGNVLDKLWGALRGTPSTQEMRVHVFNGAVTPELTLPRYSPFASMSTAAQATEAENFVKDVLNRLPKNMQKGTYALDVAPVVGGGFKIIESNPGYRSGFLSPAHNPLASFQLHRAITGRSSPIGAGIGAGLAGAGAGLAAHELATQLSKEEGT